MNITADVCPLCLSSGLFQSGKEFLRCGDCGAVINLSYTSLEYNDSYFTEEYRNQYGQTYFDDFENIYNLSRQRVEKIIKILAKTGKLRGGMSLPESLSLLDIGSAAGFFLKCARDYGFSYVKGVEISAFAAQYAKDRFGFDVDVVPFTQADIGINYDVITAWYYIEHSPDPLCDFKRIFYALKRGGIFAFSAPSVFGPLFVFNRKKWEDTHPADHFVDFTPRTAVKILKKTGFRRVSVRAAGIHPERILSPSSVFYPLFSFLYTRIAKALKFSDTIEVYAAK